MSDDPETNVVETEWISAQVPKDLAQAFRELAKARERAVSAELRLAMRDRLAAAKDEAAA